MPSGMGRLTSLQILDKFVLGAKGVSRISELRNLNHLHGKLAILGLENVTRVKDAEEAQLHKKYGLEELNLQWNEVDDGMQDVVDENTISGVLEQLKPHTSIKICELQGYRGLTLPAWLGDVSFKNMVNINLVNCTRCERLPPLGNLPSLTYLRVEGMEGIKQVGEEFYGTPDCSSVPFKALRALIFRKMKNCEKWAHSPVDNNRAFPCLQGLVVVDCESLQGDLPPHMPSLEILKIKMCKDLSISLPSLPLLGVLEVYNCRVLSISADVIFCSNMMDLSDISEIIGFPGYCPHLRGKLRVIRCHFLSTITRIPTTFRQVKIKMCNELKSVEFEKSTSSSCLEKLEVVDCKSLVAIPEIPLTLRSLDIVRCDELKLVEFEKSTFSRCLEKLAVVDCNSLVAIPEIPLTLRSLYIVHCDELKLVEFEKSTSSRFLEKLQVVDCKSLVAITKIPLTLRDLEIANCKKLEVVEFQKLDYSSSSSSSWGMGSRGEAALSDEVASISIQDSLSPLTPSPQAPSQLPFLIRLCICNCPSLISLPPSLLLPALEQLDFWYCENMEGLPSEMHTSTSLRHLGIRGCPKIQCFAKGGLPRYLWYLSIEGVNIKQKGVHLVDVGSYDDSEECLSLPSSLFHLAIKGFQNLKSFVGDFTSLEYLSLENCPKFCYFSKTGFFPRNLSKLSIINFIEKPIREWELHLLTSLQDLELRNVEGSSIIDDTVECIPGPDLYLPSSLTRLEIDGFSNLKTICCSTLPNLKEIAILSCPKFESFGNNGLPPQLEFVRIYQVSDLLEQHLERDPDGPILFNCGKYSLR